MKSVIVVRHGHTNYEKSDRRILSSEGESQMEELVRCLCSRYESVPHEEFAVVCSPKQWAHASARIVADALACDCSVLDSLDTSMWFGTSEENAGKTRRLLQSIKTDQTATVLVVITHREMAEAISEAVNGELWTCKVEEGKGWRIEGVRAYRFP